MLQTFKMPVLLEQQQQQTEEWKELRQMGVLSLSTQRSLWVVAQRSKDLGHAAWHGSKEDAIAKCVCWQGSFCLAAVNPAG